VCANRFGSGFQWATHATLARRAGVTDEELAAIERRDPSGLAGTRRTAHRVAAALVDDHQLDPDLFEEARAELGDRGIVDLAVLIGQAQLLATVLVAFDFTLDEGGS
jgi:alkylhydroperoxidase family enzyme